MEANEAAAPREDEHARLRAAIPQRLATVSYFLVACGVVRFLLLRSQVASALGSLQGVGLSAPPRDFILLAALREQLVSEVSAYGVLALLTLGFAFWAKRHPFPAMVTTLAVWVALCAFVDFNNTQVSSIVEIVQAVMLFGLLRGSVAAYSLR